MARLVILIVLLAALFLVGCLPAGVQIFHLRVDPGLSVQQLEHERIAILPALASSPLMDSTELAPFSTPSRGAPCGSERRW